MVGNAHPTHGVIARFIGLKGSFPMKSKPYIILVAGLIIGIGIGAFTMFYAQPAGVSTEGAYATKEKKILFYRNPMNPAVTSPTPKKDEMGMDYVPVYEEEGDEAAGEDTPGTVRISTEKIQKIGVRSEIVKRRSLRRVIRTVGRIPVGEAVVLELRAACCPPLR